jgi:hypothetical protein
MRSRANHRLLVNNPISVQYRVREGLATIRPEPEGRGEMMLEDIAAENDSIGLRPGRRLSRYDLPLP